jgi:hypothetical protein
VEPGLYLTFFNEGEPFNAELPPVGPLEHVVVRDGSLVADRRAGQEADHFAAGGRWIEAESELRRATGREPGGVKRSALRIAAPEGVWLRFVSFGVAVEQDKVPELGPYAVVVIGQRGVEADGDSLATRNPTNNLWELTGVGGSAFIGLSRPDVAFRTRSTVYHPETSLIRPPAPPVQAQRPASRPVAAVATMARPAEESTPTLRARIGSEPSPGRSYLTVQPEAEQREWGGAAWQLRYFIIAALVVLIIVFSVPSIRSALSGGGPTDTTVGVGTAVTSPDWTYSVGSVRRMTKIGAAQPRGTYLVVQVGVTNRGRAGAQLQPSSFTLSSASGESYAPSATNSAVYSGAGNTDSAYIWPADFPVGRQVVVPLIFDVNPSISGTELVIADVPTTRVRLE